MKIIKIEKSSRKNKRFKITMDDQKKYDFGLDSGRTYIDHHDKIKRDAYRKRHYGNDTERLLIDSLTPSPALFSYFILWGDHTDIEKNINQLNKLLR